MSGATSLAAYAQDFADRAVEHSKSARCRKNEYFFSLLSLFFVIGLIFFFNISDFHFLKDHLAVDILLNLTLAAYILKAIILFFGFQIVQFFRKNYNAEKHLEETYKHRSDVLRSLHAVYNSIDDKAQKDRILSAGALFAYERGETGYITTKEGAGTGEGAIENLIGRLLR